MLDHLCTGSPVAQVVKHLGQLLRWQPPDGVWPRLWRRGGGSSSECDSGEAGTALRAAADALREQGRQQEEQARSGLVRVESSDFQRDYHPHVPGCIVYMHRLPAPSGSERHGEGDTAEGMGFVLVDARHPVLRSIRLTRDMISDHYVDARGFVNSLAAAAAQVEYLKASGIER